MKLKTFHHLNEGKIAYFEKKIAFIAPDSWKVLQYFRKSKRLRLLRSCDIPSQTFLSKTRVLFIYFTANPRSNCKLLSSSQSYFVSRSYLYFYQPSTVGISTYGVNCPCPEQGRNPNSQLLSAIFAPILPTEPEYHGRTIHRVPASGLLVIYGSVGSIEADIALKSWLLGFWPCSGWAVYPGLAISATAISQGHDQPIHRVPVNISRYSLWSWGFMMGAI